MTTAIEGVECVCVELLYSYEENVDKDGFEL